ncbi:hypothetical protein ACH5RR_030009 [Cinchona calisaya]|uniref:RNase H type-1 domain-containing protein n=1 Tax=Cinchona calisaya TaxID=153742 RepID=A0ABD2YUK4_9GENT
MARQRATIVCWGWGLIRDHLGKCIVGFMRNLGTSSNLLAELWELRDGLCLAAERNFYLEIEVDAEAIVQLIFSIDISSHAYANIICDCRFYLKTRWKLAIKL